MRQTARVTFEYPSAPPPPPPNGSSNGGVPPYGSVDEPPRPPALRHVLTLLLINLGLSIALTIAVLIARHSVINYQLDHSGVTDPAKRTTLRDTYTINLWSRVGGNIVVSIIYAFLVRALLRGRRWAYRRVILIGALGIVSLLLIQAQHYPSWMRIEQLVQAVVLAALLYFVLRPDVRAYYAKDLPGRTVRRFRKQ